MTESVARSDVRTPGHSHTRPPWRLGSAAAARLDGAMQELIVEVAGDLAPAALRSVAGGGKRLRPALTLAVASAAALPSTEAHAAAFRVASAVELLHRATLVHDDLLDGSSVRHGAATVNADEGQAHALLTGDVLIAAAHVAAAQAGGGAALVLARTLGDLCRGEARQDAQRFSTAVTVDEVIDVARLKTGSLLRAAAMMGSEVAGLDNETTQALGRFGAEFGTALQLVDDLLDVFADAQAIGKPVGADFAGGTVTLPAIIAMQHHPELRELLRPELGSTAQRQAHRLLRCRPAAQVTRDAAFGHAHAAAQELDGPARRNPGLARIARWPEQYVRHQLRYLLPG